MNRTIERELEMLRHMKWGGTLSLALIAMALLAVATEARAQTPEGTVITNTATATYTDANGNAYAPVSGSVSVTVGFKAGVTVTANTPSPAAASPTRRQAREPAQTDHRPTRNPLSKSDPRPSRVQPSDQSTLHRRGCQLRLNMYC